VRRAVLLVLVAAVGAVLLWPRDLPATPPPVAASEVFTAAQIADLAAYVYRSTHP